MSIAAALRTNYHPRNACPLNDTTAKQLEADKKNRQRRRQHKKAEAKKRRQTAWRIGKIKKLQEGQTRFASTTVPPTPTDSDRHTLDMLLAKQAHTRFGTPIILNAR